MAGILLDGLELQDEAGGYWFDFIEGGPDDPPAFVGEDDVIPGASGMDPGGWTIGTRSLRIHGVVWGDGATLQLLRQSYRSRMDALVAKMQTTDLHDVVAHPPNFGLTIGTTATLSDVRPMRIVGPPALQEVKREITLELVSIASPPSWVIA